MSVLFIRKASDLILDVANRLQGKIKRAFLHAVQSLNDSIGSDLLVEAIKTGDVNRALSLLAIDDKFTKVLNGSGQESNIQSFRSVLEETFTAGATTAFDALPKVISTAMSFNLMNPETTQFLENYSFNQIRQISANTKEAIRDVLTDAFTNGGHPYEQARKIRGFIGLTDTQAKAVLNYRKSLESTDSLRSALKRSLRDGRFDSSIQSAIRNNKGLNSGLIDKMVTRYEERYKQYRAQTIARSESIRASNKGQRALWLNARRQGLLDDKVEREWIASEDDKMCEICGGLNGQTAGLEEEFDDGILDPGDPHSDCRCGVRLVFPKAA